MSQNPVFIPGPTNMPESLRKAIDLPTMDHRSSAFAEILHPALDGVKKVLKTEKGEAFIFPTSGTGGWETAIGNTLFFRTADRSELHRVAYSGTD